MGCSINSLRAIMGRTDIEFGDHAAYEELIGVPRILARLEDRIFEQLPDGIAQEWPVRFANTIPEGVDLSRIWPQFAVWLLVDEVDGVIKYAKTEQQRIAIRQVADLYTQHLSGVAIDASTWRADAAAAAAAAAYAADAAAYAADAATYAAAYAAAYAADAADAAAYAADAAAAAADAADAAAYAADAAADAADAKKRHYIKMADKLAELFRELAPIDSTPNR